jgi:hypothetical protein
LALFGRRLSERGDGLHMPASENLHTSRLMHRSKQYIYSITSSARASNCGGTIEEGSRPLFEALQKQLQR